MQLFQFDSSLKYVFKKIIIKKKKTTQHPPPKKKAKKTHNQNAKTDQTTRTTQKAFTVHPNMSDT